MSASTLEPCIRVFLLIENRLLREALSRLLGKHAEFQVIAVAGLNEVSLPELNAANCDVLAIDFFDPRYLPSRIWPDTTEIKTVLIGMDGDSD